MKAMATLAIELLAHVDAKMPVPLVDGISPAEFRFICIFITGDATREI